MYSLKQQTHRVNEMTRQTSNAATAAKTIRQHLKANGVQASVTSSAYPGGSSVTVNLIDALPATYEAVKEYASAYSYENNRAANIVQARFVMVNTDYSDELTNAAREYLAANFNRYFYTADEWLHLMPRRILTGAIESDFWSTRKPRVKAA